DPFAKITVSPGQTLLESKTQLEQQIPRDRDIHLAACERRLIADGRADRRVLATLAFLSASGLRPTVASRSCGAPAAARRPGASATRPASAAGAAGNALAIRRSTGLPSWEPAGRARWRRLPCTSWRRFKAP